MLPNNLNLEEQLDAQIEEIKDLAPGQLESIWMKGQGLFKFLGQANYFSGEPVTACGCLTQVHQPDKTRKWRPFLAQGVIDSWLDRKIKADDRIPTESTITAESLPVFKEYQLLAHKRRQAYIDRQPLPTE